VGVIKTKNFRASNPPPPHLNSLTQEERGPPDGNEVISFDKENFDKENLNAQKGYATLIPKINK
jgi:hypothetical protein